MDNIDFYGNTTAIQDENLVFFEEFFAKNISSNVDPILNGLTISNPIGYDIIQNINHGKYMYYKHVTDVNLPLVDAMTACETLYPAVPQNMWANPKRSKYLVLLFGSMLFTTERFASVKALSDFIEALFMTDVPSDLGDTKSFLQLNGINTRDDLIKSCVYDVRAQSYPTGDGGLRLIPSDVIIKTLHAFNARQMSLFKSSHLTARLQTLMQCHFGITKLGYCTKYSATKVARDIRMVTGVDEQKLS